MSRITKLQAELKKISQQQLELSKEINKKRKTLRAQLPSAE
ncbi:hypothetical protein ACFTAO_08690 [Paenibacillus rhizoplanae]